MSLARKLSIICAISLIAVIMYSAPNASIYAAAAGSNGLTNPKHNSNAIHAAVSTPANINNGRWNEYSFFGAGTSLGCFAADPSGPICDPSSAANADPVGSPTWTITVPANAHATLTVTDAFHKGDNFNVFDGGLIGTTPAVATDLSSSTSDPAVTSADATWSSGQFNLAAGPHNINIKTVSASVDPVGGAAFFKVDLACNEGFQQQETEGFVCIPVGPGPVGGMGIPIDSTALLLAGVQGSALWMIPAIVVAGAGITIFKLKKKSQGESS